jgi:serine/threonine protein kinase
VISDGTQPDRDQLRRFLLGQLDDTQHERVERWLHQTPESLAPEQDLECSDVLVERLRNLDEKAEPPSSQVVGLIDRFSKLRPGEVTSETPGRGLADTTGPAPPRPSSTSFLAPPQRPDEIGRLGSFRVLRVLGEGGMGLVLEAEDVALQRRIALKVMRPEIAARSEGRQRFLREARTAAGLSHDHIVPIYQVGEEKGVLFIAMPLLAGEALEDRLRREGALSISEILRIGRETAEGLAVAHAAGLVHRDLKPSNLWLEAPTGRVKILDFGLARSLESEGNLTDPGVVVGTPAYMAPEQAKGEPLDGRSDLFSLGCVLHRMMTGSPAFQGKTHGAVLLAVMSEAPSPPHVRRPDVPRTLSDLIMQLLAKAPAGRPPSASAVTAALRALETATTAPGTSPAPAAPLSPPGAPAPAWQRWRIPLGLTVLGVFLVAGLLAWHPWQQRGTEEGSPAAPEQGSSSFPRQKPYEGFVDIDVWSKEGEQVRRTRLSESGALPLRTGDQVRIKAAVKPAAYLYVFWIDASGAERQCSRLVREWPRCRERRPPQADALRGIENQRPRFASAGVAVQPAGAAGLVHVGRQLRSREPVRGRLLVCSEVV